MTTRSYKPTYKLLIKIDTHEGKSYEAVEDFVPKDVHEEISFKEWREAREEVILQVVNGHEACLCIGDGDERHFVHADRIAHVSTKVVEDKGLKDVKAA